MIHVLIAHAAREPQADVDSVVEYVTKRLAHAEVSTAREQWNLRLGSSGSADQLAKDLGGGFRLDGKPLFDVLIFMRPYIGKRNALTARAAFGANRKVFYLDSIKFVPTRFVDCIDPNNWKAGWLLREAQ